jgi:multiple sugar transport system permease protein
MIDETRGAVTGRGTGVAVGSGRWTPYAFLVPLLLGIALFYLGPILFGVWASFQADGTVMTGGGFVAFEHYGYLLRSAQFRESLIVTVLFTVASVAATFTIGLGAALLLNRPFPGSSFVGSTLLIPWSMPLVAVAVVWGWLLDYQFGAVNFVLHQLGLITKSVGFLTNPSIALWSVTAAQVWRLFPLAMVMLLGALKAIPRELYEAAYVDGAGTWQAFRFITMPGIRSTTNALVLLLAIWAFGRAFTIVFVMTGGGPARATETLVIHTYLEAFRLFHLERASALGTLVLILSAIFTVFYLRARRD